MSYKFYLALRKKTSSVDEFNQLVENRLTLRRCRVVYKIGSGEKHFYLWVKKGAMTEDIAKRNIALLSKGKGVFVSYKCLPFKG